MLIGILLRQIILIDRERSDQTSAPSQIQITLCSSVAPIEPLRYKLRSRVKGTCLIFNNSNYRNMPTLEDAEYEAARLKTVFHKLGFKVLELKNLNADKMITEARNRMLSQFSLCG